MLRPFIIHNWIIIISIVTYKHPCFEASSETGMRSFLQVKNLLGKKLSTTDKQKKPKQGIKNGCQMQKPINFYENFNMEVIVKFNTTWWFNYFMDIIRLKW